MRWVRVTLTLTLTGIVGFHRNTHFTVYGYLVQNKININISVLRKNSDRNFRFKFIP